MNITEINTIKDQLINDRRTLHQHPELGYKEYKTSELIIKRLKDAGLTVYDHIGGTGVLGILETGRKGPCILLRAEMDALPLIEKSGVSFSSEISGVFHACGHDAHTAILIATAIVVSKRKNSLCGTIKFCFQPAEEGGNGALAMIEQGILENPNVDSCFALHTCNSLDPGYIGVKEGPVMSSSDKIVIRVEGEGGHAAFPQYCNDLILATSHLVIQLYSTVSRVSSPFNTHVLSICNVETESKAHNVLPDSVIIKGSLRTISSDSRKSILTQIENTCNGIKQSFNLKTVTFEIIQCYKLTINHSVSDVNRILESGRMVCGKDKVVIPENPSLASEDFSEFLTRRNGCYFLLGSLGKTFGIGKNENSQNQLNKEQKQDKTKSYSHHSSHFIIDEKCLIVGVKVWVQLIENILKIK